jgi:hypothetical protein
MPAAVTKRVSSGLWLPFDRVGAPDRPCFVPDDQSHRGLTFRSLFRTVLKKTLVAREQARPDVARHRQR